MSVEYAVVTIGGSIGSKIISSISELKGQDVGNTKIYTSKKEALDAVKFLNKCLSRGEKTYYRMRIKVAEVENFKFTGK